MPTSQLHISVDSITANYLSLNALSSDVCATGAAVKADAYGLGMTAIAPALHKAGCRHFFVARLDEALSLRKTFRSLNLQADIIVFDGPRSGEMNDYSAFDIIPTLNHEAQLPLLRDEAIRTQSAKRAYLHSDTAMSRLGMSPAATKQALQDAPDAGIHIDVIMSHLACADEPDNSLNEVQRERLEACCAFAPQIPVSLANSGGILLGPDYHYQLTRPGISLYGCSADDSPSEFLQPAIMWQADILQIAEVPAGSTIGYGASFTAETDMIVATIGAGYADGYPRDLSGKAYVEIAGSLAPLVGRVSMDVITVDISALTPTQRSDAQQACLIGAHYSASQMAADTHTISYEILTGLGARLLRLYDTA
ncbi:MAG: alanine racemase [Alphaproteobacteria bacterium]|nr:alanine racemase [Alphaproteobacteria bacterium]